MRGNATEMFNPQSHIPGEGAPVEAPPGEPSHELPLFRTRTHDHRRTT